MGLFGFGTKDANQLGFINTAIPVDLRSNIQIDQSKKEQKSSYQYSYQDARQYAPVDARAISLVYNSPNASVRQSTDATGARNLPSLVPSVSQPTDFGTTSATPTLSPQLNLGGGIGSMLLIGGLLLGGGLILVSAAKGGKK